MTEETINNESVTTKAKIWGPWATAGWGLLILLIFFLAQIIVGIVYVIIKLVSDSNISPEILMNELQNDGALLSTGTIAGAIIGVGAVIFFSWIRKGMPVRQYLAIRLVDEKILFKWIGIGIIFVIAADTLTYVLDRPIVPEFMLEAYKTAGFIPLLWFAVCVAAPVSEEVLFRGFFLVGFKNSKMGPVIAVLLTSFIWTIIHVQYGWYELSQIFIIGILFGAARIKTGSLKPPVIMHSVLNIIATIEAAIAVSMQTGTV